jgi:glycosyltransferase involved in cell wall biosynthesis
MLKVLIIQGEVKQYRAPFFEKLRARLREDGIVLKVGYSDPSNADNRNDNCDLPEGLGLKVDGYPLPWRHLLYQPLLRHVVASDFVIAEHGNRYLLNYLLVLFSILRLKRVAVWGMGENRSKNRSEYSESVRRKLVKWVDWCFSYTVGTKKYYEECGVPDERITVVQNAVDTSLFSRMVDDITLAELENARQELRIAENGRVALYCGVLSRDKGVDFLLGAAQRIQAQVQSFHLLVAGGGPEREAVETATRKFPWMHYLGPQFGRQKAMLFRMADVFLLPGYVGLAILDAFAAGLPLVTTNIPDHRPEIEYLESGRNGWMTEPNLEDYVSRVVELLSDDRLRQQLSQGARSSAGKYSIDTMVENFREGIHSCLGWNEMLAGTTSPASRP